MKGRPFAEVTPTMELKLRTAENPHVRWYTTESTAQAMSSQPKR